MLALRRSKRTKSSQFVSVDFICALNVECLIIRTNLVVRLWIRSFMNGPKAMDRCQIVAGALLELKKTKGAII